MGPARSIPYPDVHPSEEEYVAALLSFITTSDMLQALCGGVHILDFLTREPDLFETVLPGEWRDWLRGVEITDVLDLLMREDLDLLWRQTTDTHPIHSHARPQKLPPEVKDIWRGHPTPPRSLLRYIESVRHLTLDRSFRPSTVVSDDVKPQHLSRQIAVGMKPKKAHEVVNFACFVDEIISELANAGTHRISHLVDFGSGQNYLGRVLASPMYGREVIAVESKHLNINGAMAMDVSAKLAKKDVSRVNKKVYRKQGQRTEPLLDLSSLPPNPSIQTRIRSSTHAISDPPNGSAADNYGKIWYVEQVIQDGDLAAVISQIRCRGTTETSQGQCFELSSLKSGIASSHPPESSQSLQSDPQLMVISLHSCGNLTHHGLRSLILNDSVKVVAMVGCCYNLVTERLGPPSVKLPSLRLHHPRLEHTASAYDPHGFPMSEHMACYEHRSGKGIRLNITARMMAVQAPQNWTTTDCESFFTRHFYRALLQRIFLDHGIVGSPQAPTDVPVTNSPRGWSGDGEPIIIGSLRKACYTSFPAYVRGALVKIGESSKGGKSIETRMSSLTDQEILEYEERFKSKKHELSLIWSLMAFSAGVIESAIVVDRWLYLREQKEIGDSWIQTVFEYEHSPRNLVVVGVRR
ncbi:hypothetical protein MMC19_001389 [Ptychographa xylographoides]|nr:hypothetical protein [Ptychographa xylographoides]